MDPLTHALVGAGIAALTGEKLSMANPCQLGAVLGSLAPDFDIILQIYGDIPYLTHHRGSSHSIPGVILSSLVIAFVLWLVLGSAQLGIIFVWTFFGAISHLVLDILNSYGAKILWPFSQKKVTLNLLVLADPVIIVLFTAVVFWPGMPAIVVKGAFWAALAYLGTRFWMRKKVYRTLWQNYGSLGVVKIVVMPAMVSLWNWSFLIETSETYFVGEVRCFSLKTGIKRVLTKNPRNALIGKALNSKLGKIFQNFTPYFYIHHCIENGKDIVKFCDLRYFRREDFMHNATVVFDETHTIIEAVFHPYSRKRKIRVMG